MTIIAQTIGTNSSRDYDWLKASVAGWLHRTDLTSVIPDFVMLAEKRINGLLESRQQDLVATLTTTAGEPTVDLPRDLNSIHGMSLPPYGKVDFMDVATFDRDYASQSSGPPRNYKIVGNTIELGPTPDDVYSIKCTYRAGVPALADNAGTNWLIEQHAEIYLAATMCEALIYIGNVEKLATWEGKFAAAASALNSTDWKAAGPMVVRSDSYTP
ncbi:hypothetical protein SAMN05428966_10252 [Massilia sp. PDC64]|nr:hypothetical protein [Massilia sp. PDC64]SDC65551.1 hypothetical protein SAMN05428966_10252 [Massilia sp. PDC64]